MKINETKLRSQIKQLQLAFILEHYPQLTAQAAHRLKIELKHYLKPQILILDEIGYLPIDKQGADLLFQVFSQID